LAYGFVVKKPAGVRRKSRNLQPQPSKVSAFLRESQWENKGRNSSKAAKENTLVMVALLIRSMKLSNCCCIAAETAMKAPRDSKLIFDIPFSPSSLLGPH
jgi:hypothetical protein